METFLGALGQMAEVGWGSWAPSSFLSTGQEGPAQEAHRKFQKQESEDSK